MPLATSAAPAAIASNNTIPNDSPRSEGAQNTVLAGGRYDGLVEKMGSKSVPAIGFAAGIERLMLLTKINQV